MFEDIPDASGIYAIVNTTTGERYVGQAKHMRARIQAHLRELSKGSHQTNKERRLQEAWNKFGSDVFRAVVLEIVVDNSGPGLYPDNLSLAEHYYIGERGEYNVDDRIVRNEFADLIAQKAWRT